MPVVDDDELKGIVTGRDFRYARDMEQTVSEIMTPREKLITVKEGETQDVVKSLMYKHRIEKILVLDDKDKLVGLMTMKDIEKSIDYPLASRDLEGRLIVGAAIGVGKDLMLKDICKGKTQMQKNLFQKALKEECLLEVG